MTERAAPTPALTPTPAPAPGILSGALAIAAAKAWFLLAGLIHSILTPWAIGQEGFGAFKRAMAFVNVPNNILIVASIQTVSRAIAAADEPDRPATLRRALTIHTLLGLGLGLVFASAVPLIVAHQRAPHLAPPLYAFAVVLAAYGIYAPLVGGLNGTRRFARQAMLDAGFSTTRTVLICVVGYLFVHSASHSSSASASPTGPSGALGAALGFAATALLVLPFAFASVPLRGAGTSRLHVRAHLGFLLSLASAQLFQTLLLQMDLVLLGRLAVTRLMDAGLSQTDAGVQVDRLAGLYAQAQGFGLVPYQILVAASYVLFPAIAAARARGDEGALRADVERGGRATLLVAGLLVAAMAGTPVAVLRFAFGVGKGAAIPSAEGAPILQALACAHGITAVGMVAITLVAATGKGRVAAALSALVCATTLGSAFAFARLHATVDVALGVALARGMAVGLAIGVAVAVLYVRRTLGKYVALLPLARVVLGVAAALVVGRYVPTPASRLLCALLPIVPLAVYLAVVTVLGERPWQLRRRARVGEDHRPHRP